MLTSLFPLKEPLLNPFDLPRPRENLGVDCDLTLLGAGTDGVENLENPVDGCEDCGNEGAPRG